MTHDCNTIKLGTQQRVIAGNHFIRHESNIVARSCCHFWLIDNKVETTVASCNTCDKICWARKVEEDTTS